MVTATATKTTTAPSTRRPALARLTVQGKLYQKGSSTDALLKRVKQARTELSEMDQDAVDVNSLREICKELVTPALMLHKDKAVKANVACCLADMLRLFAPNAPFTPTELRDIFQFFLHQLTMPAAGLSKPNGPQYTEYFYLLESLSNVKSVVLVCDLTNADEMMAEYFKGLLDLARPDMSKNVEICLADVLVQLIDECASLPSEVLDLLLANFTSKAVKHNPSAHRMAVEVCSNTKDRLQKYVAQYFNEVINTASQEDDQDEKLESLQTAHSLIIQINRVVPSLLLNVIPQLEEELRAEDIQLRTLATKVLGQMFSEKPNNAAESSDLAKRYANTWRAWLGRANDKSASLRMVWIESTKGLIVNHPELRPDLTPIITQKLLEPDERVRAAMAKSIGSLDYETALHHVDKAVLLTLAGRCKDTKALVRKESLDAVGKLFDMAYSEIENQDPAATQQFAWIPQEIFKCLYAGDRQMQQMVAATVEHHILPVPSTTSDEDQSVSWTSRLLLVMAFLDSDATKAMLRLSNLITPRPSIADSFLDCCEQYNGGEVALDKDSGAVKLAMADRIRRCATQFASPEKARADLHAFAKLNDGRIYKLLRTSFDPQQDIKTLVKSRNDALRRIGNSNGSILDTMTGFIQGNGYFILNRSSVPELIKKLQVHPRQAASSLKASSSQLEENDQMSETQRTSANYLLEFMAKHSPQMFVLHVPELCKALYDANNDTLTQACLRALASVAQWTPSKVSLDKKSIDRLSQFILKGTPKQSKFAAKLLCIVATGGVRGGRKAAGQKAGLPGTSVSSSAAYSVLEETLDSLAKHLGNSKPDRQAASLEALSQMFKNAPDASENVSDTIVKTILNNILMVPLSSTEVKSYTSSGEDWIEDSAIEAELQARLLCLLVLTKRCEAFAETESANDMARPIFRLLWTVISAGEARSLDTPAAAKARMRLQAALCVLKLVRHKAYDACIGRQYFNLAFMVQDESFNVRTRMICKVLSYLAVRRIDSKYLAMMFLAAYDPEKENRERVAGHCKGALRATSGGDQRLHMLDLNFPRFIHLLANHPDFSKDSSAEVAGFVRYLEFFLDCLCNSSNISLFYYLATRVKGVRDAESQGASENLYALSELAQLVINRRAHAQGWTVESYPGQVRLPTDIFKPLPSRDVQREIYERQYLPQDLVQKLSEPTKATKSTKGSSSGAQSIKKFSVTTTTANRKRKSATSAPNNNGLSRKKHRSSDNDDENGDSSELSDVDDDEETS